MQLLAGPQFLTHSGWRPPSLNHYMDLSIGQLPTWQSASPRQNNLRESKRPSNQMPAVHYDLASRVAHHHVPFILFIRSQLPGPAHRQGKENLAAPLEGRSVKECVDMFFQLSVTYIYLKAHIKIMY